MWRHPPPAHQPQGALVRRACTLILSAPLLLSALVGCGLGAQSTGIYRPDPDAAQQERIILRTPALVEPGLPYTDPPLTTERPLDVGDPAHAKKVKGEADAPGGRH